MGEKVKSGNSGTVVKLTETGLDNERAKKGNIEVVMRCL
jgi:hypothetical protein